MFQRNKKGGIATNTVFGVGGLIVLTIVILVVVQTMGNANLFADNSHTLTVTNETSAYANTTGYSLAIVNSSNSAYAITAVWNATDDGAGSYNLSIPLANVSVDSAGLLTNGTVIVYENVSVSYTYTNTYTSGEEAIVDDLRSNYSSGLTNVGNKIPVILLIIAVVILFGALVLLIRNSQLMGIGNSSSL